MAEPRFVDYSGAAPILLPVDLLPYWHGFYLPVAGSGRAADLELPEGGYYIPCDFDFVNPRTDYDRACSLGGRPAVQALPVGPGHGLVFATELDALTWWPEQQLLVNGGCLPDLSRLAQVEWSDELVWTFTEAEHLLLNACDHGGAPRKDDALEVLLPPGEYRVQRGDYGWADDDPALVLFRFLPSS